MKCIKIQIVFRCRLINNITFSEKVFIVWLVPVVISPQPFVEKENVRVSGQVERSVIVFLILLLVKRLYVIFFNMVKLI